MRKVFAPIAVTAAIGCAFLMIPAAHADSTNAAVHINGQECGLMDGSGNLVIVTAEKTVITSSGNGNITCKATGVANTTGQAVNYSGFECGTFNNVTTDSHETVSANGNATLSCHSST